MVPLNTQGFLDGYKARLFYHKAAQSLERFVESKDPLDLGVAEESIRKSSGIYYWTNNPFSQNHEYKKGFQQGVTEADRIDRLRHQYIEALNFRDDFANIIAAGLGE